MLASAVLNCCTDEVRQRDTGNLDRVLEREEHTLLGNLICTEISDVFIFESDGTTGNLITRIAHEGGSEGRLTCTIGSHDNDGLTTVDIHRDSVKDLLLFFRYGYEEVSYFQQFFCHDIPSLQNACGVFICF